MTAIQDPLDRLAAVPNHLRLAHARALALRSWIAELEAPLRIGIEGGGVGDVNNPGNNLPPLVALARASQASDLIAAERLLALIEASFDHIEAVLVIEPLLELAAADVAEIAEAERKEREALAALDDAEAAARVKLEAKIASDPAVARAKADLSKIRRLGRPLDDEASDVARELAADLP